MRHAILILAANGLIGCVTADQCVSGATRDDEGRCVGPAIDATVPSDGADEPDLVIAMDAGVLDMGFEPEDMGAPSSDASPLDAGPGDAGPDDMFVGDGGPCPGAVAFDDVTRRCLYREAWTSGPLCPEGLQPLRWGLVEGQQRFETLFRAAGVGPGGVGLEKIDGEWTWVETGVVPPAGIIEWATGEPSAPTHEYAYFSDGERGVHSRFEPHPWQFCMGPVL